MVGAERVQLFQLPRGGTQAIADAVVMEQKINTTQIVLSAWTHEDWGCVGRDSKRSVTLKPDVENGTITLVILNTPVYSAKHAVEKLRGFYSGFLQPLTDGASNEAFTAAERTAFHTEGSHDHFQHYYGLFDCTDCGGFPRLMDGRSTISPGICEPYLECLESLYVWEPIETYNQTKSEDEKASLTVSAVHNLSRCDTPTYP